MTKNTAPVFEVVEAEAVPDKIKRSGRAGTSMWQSAVDTLRTLEVGAAISLVVHSDDDKNRTRQGIIGAVKRSAPELNIATRTEVINSSTEDYAVKLYFVRREDDKS